MNMKFKTFIEVEVEVDYTPHPACRGARDSLGGKANAGPPLEPDEPGWCEITAVKIDNYDLLQHLEQKQVDSLVEEAGERYADYIESCEESRAEARLEDIRNDYE